MGRALLAVLMPLLLAAPAAADLVGGAAAVRRTRDTVDHLEGDPPEDRGFGLSARLRFGDRQVARLELGFEMDAIPLEEADHDPILMATLLASLRGELGRSESVRPFWTVGAGAGAVVLGRQGLALPLRVGLGASFAPLSRLGFEVALFDRLLLMTGGRPRDSPRGEDPRGTSYAHSIGIEAALRFGR